MHNHQCLRQAQAKGHERTGPSVLQQGDFPANKRCSVKENCYAFHHLFTIFLSQVEEQPIHTVSEHAELEGRTRTFSRDDQAPPRRHRYSKPFLQAELIDSASYAQACLCINYFGLFHVFMVEHPISPEWLEDMSSYCDPDSGLGRHVMS